MVRSVVIALALVCFAASSAGAQTVTRDDATLRGQVKAAFAQASQPKPAATAPTSRTIRFTPSANSTLLTPADARRAATAPAPAQGKKNFFKTPWPYVIIVAVAAIVIVAANSGSGGGY